MEAWNNCLEEVQYRPIQEVRPIYETLVANFPTCGRYWKFYIDHEVKYLFRRLTCFHITPSLLRTGSPEKL